MRQAFLHALVFLLLFALGLCYHSAQVCCLFPASKPHRQQQARLAGVLGDPAGLGPRTVHFSVEKCCSPKAPAPERRLYCITIGMETESSFSGSPEGLS